MGVMRIGHVSLRVMDMAAAVSHYESAVGLSGALEDESGHVYLKFWDEWDRPGLGHMAYKVRNEADLDALKGKVEAYGVAATMLPEGSMVGIGRMLQFNTSDNARRGSSATLKRSVPLS
jgi:catechol 2,3-dioxygenase